MKKPPLFAIAADNWRNDVLSLTKYATYVRSNFLLRQILLEFGSKRVDEITKHDIQRFIVKLSQRMGTSTIKDYLWVIKGVIEYADDEWEMPRRLKLPKATSPKQPFYSFEEVRKMLPHTSEKFRTLIMFLAETGCRVGEALVLQKSDFGPGYVKITRNVIHGIIQDKPKTESSIRKINLSSTLLTEIQKLWDHKFIFGNSQVRPIWPGEVNKEVKRICEKIGIEYRKVHAFRRGNVRELLLNLRIPERVVGARIGHKSSENILLGVYCQTQDDDDLQYVKAIEGWLYKGER